MKTIVRVALVCAAFTFVLGCGSNKTAGSGSSGTTHGTGATGASGASTAAAAGSSGSTEGSTSAASTSGSTAGSTSTAASTGSTAGSTSTAASTGSSAASTGSTSTTGSTSAASTGSTAASTSGTGSTAAASTGSTGAATTTGSTGSTGTTGGCPTPGTDRFYVDASASPTGNGSQQCPFTTITEGLAAATASPASAVTVQVEPGTYDANLGEVFPLVVPAKVKVTGDTPAASSRNAFVIDGSGSLSASSVGLTVGVVLMGEIDYMLIEDSNPVGNDPDAIVYAASGTPHLSLVSVDGTNVTTAAMLITSVAGSQGATVTLDNQGEFKSSDADGILIEPGTGTPPTVTITGALVHDNANDGVHITASNGSAPTVNLNGTSADNFFFCNGDYGVDSAVSVDARGNSWDHDANALTDGSGGNGPPADVNDFAVVNTANAVAPSANACNQ
ncbi:MAG: DUF1565 domain-containing protein [Deltaproteobacteria bacterium]|nr:DUF1565 domain-containing protein [Deltaproteobacteria bacterium]